MKSGGRGDFECRGGTGVFPRRTSGILLHPTCLPGPYGIGTLGKNALRFVDFLVRAGQSLWQILPLGPTGCGDSPYATFGSSAGNPLLIDLDELVAAGDLDRGDLAGVPQFPAEEVDFRRLLSWKRGVLETAANRFLSRAEGHRRAEFSDFCAAQADWLDDFALFMAVKEYFDQRAAGEDNWDATWSTYWDRPIALREPDALQQWRKQVSATVDIQKVWQYYFFHQWAAVKRYANDRQVRILGDIPIFVASDSADVWVNRQLFRFDDQGHQTVVAGVPPDYFSATGQRWGNPLYDWQAMQEQDFAWWTRRIRDQLQLVDILRIDHFRGFEACWEIPADTETAEHGSWVKAPGRELFETLARQLHHLPLVAEDLGLITPEVSALRRRFGFPGMRVLQFGFENLDPRSDHLPHNHECHGIVYTGTHDNNTTVGWYESLHAPQRQAIDKYLNYHVHDVAWDLIRVAMGSVANAAIYPLQDVLRLGAADRMNTPGTLWGNWKWRLRSDYADGLHAEQLADLTRMYGRDRGG